MENWRTWLGLEEDPPADGMKPIDPKVYDIHVGGEESQLPLLNAPDDIPVGAPIKDRPGLSIDKPAGAPADWSIDKLNRNVQDLRKSDAGPLGRSRQDIIDNLANKWNVQFRELTRLEAADTISKHDASRRKEALLGFRELLAQADTVDIDLVHLNKELNNMRDSIRTLKTKA